jgi:hypothetical protein
MKKQEDANDDDNDGGGAGCLDTRWHTSSLL